MFAFRRYELGADTSSRFVPRAKMHGMQMLGLLGPGVISAIEVPYLPISMDPSTGLSNIEDSGMRAEAERFDLEIFSPREVKRESTTGSVRSMGERRHRNSSTLVTGFQPIEESPNRPVLELPPEPKEESESSTLVSQSMKKSPSQTSMRSIQSHRSTGATSLKPPAKGSLASKLTPAWLFNPFRTTPSEPQTSQVSASAIPSRPQRAVNPSTATAAVPAKPLHEKSPTAMPISQSPSPMAIRRPTPSTIGRSSNLSRTFEEEAHLGYRGSVMRRSPMNTPPRDDGLAFKRRSFPTTHPGASASSSSPGSSTNPTRTRSHVSYTQSSLARRWQHMLPQKLHKHDIKWDALVTPPCLPLTVEYFPTQTELDYAYEVFSYDFVVDPSEMRSFFVEPPNVKGNTDEVRRAWALAVMRGMAGVRLAQGFQFVVRSPSQKVAEQQQQQRPDERPAGSSMRRFLTADEDPMPKLAGAAEVLRSALDPVYLSMSNEIHRLSYTGEAIQVRRYMRRMLPAKSFEYHCLIWPKLGGNPSLSSLYPVSERVESIGGYTELSTTFSSHGLENYGWNR